MISYESKVRVNQKVTFDVYREHLNCDVWMTNEEVKNEVEKIEKHLNEIGTARRFTNYGSIWLVEFANEITIWIPITLLEEVSK